MNEFQQLRKEEAALTGRKTLHGIPRNRRTYSNYNRSIEMQEELSKGHLNDEHKASHVRKIDNRYTPNERVNMAISELKQRYFNTYIGYERNRNKVPSQYAQRMLQEVVPMPSPRNLFNPRSTMSPYSKIRKKLIRPLTILIDLKHQTGKNNTRRVKQSLMTAYTRNNFKALTVMPI